MLGTQNADLENAIGGLELENESLKQGMIDAQTQLGFVDGQLVLLYTTVEGDTAESIAMRFYGSAELLTQLTESNPDVDFKKLTAGTELRIVGPVNLRLALPIEEPTVSESPAVESTESATTSSETN
jgi:nucleoid-associated protein YgaU